MTGRQGGCDCLQRSRVEKGVAHSRSRGQRDSLGDSVELPKTLSGPCCLHETCFYQKPVLIALFSKYFLSYVHSSLCAVTSAFAL